MSNEYLRGQRLPFTPEVSSYTRFILDLYDHFQKARKSGSTLFPFSSWITLYGELGFIGVFLLAILIMRSIFRIRSMTASGYPQLPVIVLIFMLYWLGLGFQDNYWEYTQAIFPGVLLMTICYALLENGPGSHKEAVCEY